ncbi:hypothetical protein [Metamycoplasma hyosynoviae]|uniref:hypothetical protein n=1 Tax=Metamycoplasma hyosynoviae TaxID=29559 RepID=UPI00235F8D4F|nr:hypothetical protein [Metamycoplasma hyosynoviae]MDD1371662.1 hypothetical protein [Metamycoplasma hyosynoviae]
MKSLFKLNWLTFKRSVINWILIGLASALIFVMTAIQFFSMRFIGNGKIEVSNFLKFTYITFFIESFWVILLSCITTARVYQLPKTNGISYILFSKPISRPKIYWTNLLISYVLNFFNNAVIFISIFISSIIMLSATDATAQAKTIMFIKYTFAFAVTVTFIIMFFMGFIALLSAKLKDKATLGTVLGSYFGLMFFSTIIYTISSLSGSKWDFIAASDVAISKKNPTKSLFSTSSVNQFVRKTFFTDREKLKFDATNILELININSITNQLFTDLMSNNPYINGLKGSLTGSYGLYIPRKVNKNDLIGNYHTIYSFDSFASPLSYDQRKDAYLLLADPEETNFVQEFIKKIATKKSIEFFISKKHNFLNNTLKIRSFNETYKKEMETEIKNIAAFSQDELNEIKKFQDLMEKVHKDKLSISINDPDFINFKTKFNEIIENKLKKILQVIWKNIDFKFNEEQFDNYVDTIVNEKFNVYPESSVKKELIEQELKKYKKFKEIIKAIDVNNPETILNFFEVLTNHEIDIESSNLKLSLIKNYLLSELSKNILTNNSMPKELLSPSLYEESWGNIKSISIDDKKIHEITNVKVYPWYFTIIIILSLSIGLQFLGQHLYKKESFKN